MWGIVVSGHDGHFGYCPSCGSDEEYLQSQGLTPSFPDEGTPYLFITNMREETLTPEELGSYVASIIEGAQVPGDLESIFVLRMWIKNKQQRDKSSPETEKDYRLYEQAIDRLEEVVQS